VFLAEAEKGAAMVRNYAGARLGGGYGARSPCHGTYFRLRWFGNSERRGV